MITTRQSEQNRGAMPATFAASDWLRRAAEIWAEADAADDLTTKRLKIMLAQGCERIAQHVGAQMKAELKPETNEGRSKPSVPERLLRGLVALLATPFLLLMMAAVVSWLKVSGKLPVHRQMMFASVWATSLTWPQLMASA